jgi:hypothetical protein
MKSSIDPSSMKLMLDNQEKLKLVITRENVIYLELSMEEKITQFKVHTNITLKTVDKAFDYAINDLKDKYHSYLLEKHRLPEPVPCLEIKRWNHYNKEGYITSVFLSDGVSYREQNSTYIRTKDVFIEQFPLNYTKGAIFEGGAEIVKRFINRAICLENGEPAPEIEVSLFTIGFPPKFAVSLFTIVLGGTVKSQS